MADPIYHTTDQAPGAWPNGTHVEKMNSEPGDAHQNGAGAVIIGSIGPVRMEVGGLTMRYGYFVIWDDAPGWPVFIADQRIREKRKR